MNIAFSVFFFSLYLLLFTLLEHGHLYEQKYSSSPLKKIIFLILQNTMKSPMQKVYRKGFIWIINTPTEFRLQTQKLELHTK